jgi:hypothetical protein
VEWLSFSDAVTGCDIADALMRLNKPPSFLVSY